MMLRQHLDVVANNLANINTNAYRAERLVFAEQLQEVQNGDNLSFVQGLATIRDLTEGQKTSTGGDLDLAIAGRGFFEVTGEGGAYYTRDGAFRLDDDGELLIKGPNLFSGYFKEEEATAASFTSDGYFRTGDIARERDLGLDTGNQLAFARLSWRPFDRHEFGLSYYGDSTSG